MECQSQPTTSTLSSSLWRVLSNTLLLYQTVPYLPISSLLALGATSKSFKTLIYETPHVFRYLKLSDVKSAEYEVEAIDQCGEVWRNAQWDENLTEDDFYGGPLRGIFKNLCNRNILLDVQTLILDGLSVPSDLLSEIILNESYNVRLLSIREVQNLNEAKLRGALKYSCRPSRPKNTPRLQGLYIFGLKDKVIPQVVKYQKDVMKYPASMAPIDAVPNYGVTSSQGAQLGAQWNPRSEIASEDGMLREGEVWHPGSGNVFPKPIHDDWAAIMVYCEGIISFDAFPCRGPRHLASLPRGSPGLWYDRLQNRVEARAATHSLNECSSCGSSKDASVFGQSPMVMFPLLSPLPLHASSIKAAKTPFDWSTSRRKLMVRCMDCLRNRYCENCRKWWCEDCYQGTSMISSTGNSLISPSAKTESEAVKVHMGLCVENCLVAEMMSGAGSNGMWG
ncbi:hypothetical protein DSL72_000553 [Monilinia vaccinii-corymbosi]|uniref:F-box domain-containing protein n=1 Tax=Monilinia vaccinii-corymbosi TaxID=61207 RepID=A0A8A3P1W4_9HELO|nr:hypothetical protein DSL72_000553 [Monilinia vaccinii-corymbosi]